MDVRPASPVKKPIPPPGAGTLPPRPKSSRRKWALIKTIVWILALLPVANLLYDALTGGLAAEPVKDITHRTGWWALTLLLVTLAITPLRYLSGWKQAVKLRRPIGLFAFFYATLHVLTYFGLDQLFSFDYILEDIVERPFITVGFAAWVILLSLAVTSTKGWMRRMGRRWDVLHRFVYLAAALGALHFFWLVKADIREPLIFAGILAFLMTFRLPVVQRLVARRRLHSHA